MQPFMAHLIITVGLLMGTFTDLKRREVPDWLNFGLIGLGLGLGALGSVLDWSIMPLISSAVGLIVGVAIGYIMYYAGQWGGGDAKLIMGLGALMGLNLLSGVSIFDLPLFLTFIINTVLVGAAYGLLWALIVALRHRKTLKAELKKKLQEPIITRYRVVVLTTTALLVIGAFVAKSPVLTLSFAILAFILFFIFYLWLITKAVEKTCMVKELPVSKLTEGDWIYHDIWVKDGERTLNEHLQAQMEQRLVLKEEEDLLMGFYRQAGLGRRLKRREQKLAERARKRTQARLEAIIKAIAGKEKLKAPTVAEALADTKKLKAFLKKRPWAEDYLKEQHQYRPGYRRISGPVDLGITREQIEELKRTDIARVTVKEGIPFVPSFLLAYIATMLLGSWWAALL